MRGRYRPGRLHPVRTFALYVRALLYEFRWTLVGVAAVLALGTVLYLRSPAEFDDKRPPTLLNAMFASWMAMLAQPINAPPTNWYLNLLCGIYPALGFVLIGEGVVRLAPRRQAGRQHTGFAAHDPLRRGHPRQRHCHRLAASPTSREVTFATIRHPG